VVELEAQQLDHRGRDLTQCEQHVAAPAVIGNWRFRFFASGNARSVEGVLNQMNENTRTKLLAVIGGSALVSSVLVVSVVSGPAGDAVAGSGNGVVQTFSQPTQPAMTIGATATAGPAPLTLTTSLASPTAKASKLATECNTTGQCP
jgi:hypothetical protein